jgi:hypothetical protein
MDELKMVEKHLTKQVEREGCGRNQDMPCFCLWVLGQNEEGHSGALLCEALLVETIWYGFIKKTLPNRPII